jgi:DNA-directed RNA polymerase specialized sigma24 family protein
MIEYREIQGISQRAIAESLSCSRNTVAKVLQRA